MERKCERKLKTVTQKEPKGEFVVIIEGKSKEETIVKSNKEKYGK